MRAVIQRVSSASVVVDNDTVGSIGLGLLILLGVGENDTDDDLEYIFRKTSQLRIFSDADGKMNLNLEAVQGSVLIISQFTLFASTKKGNRPSFIQAAAPEKANAMYEQLCLKFRASGYPTENGVFGADMKVTLLNDGPVTIIIDSKDRK